MMIRAFQGKGSQELSLEEVCILFVYRKKRPGIEWLMEIEFEAYGDWASSGFN